MIQHQKQFGCREGK